MCLFWHDILCMNENWFSCFACSRLSYIILSVFDVWHMLLKSFHVKFYFSFTYFFFQTKGISHEKQMQTFLFFYLLFYKISTQKSSCSYWLCECEAYPNYAWEIQIWILFQLLHSLHINCLSLKGILGSAWNSSDWFKKKRF